MRIEPNAPDGSQGQLGDADHTVSSAVQHLSVAPSAAPQLLSDCRSYAALSCCTVMSGRTSIRKLISSMVWLFDESKRASRVVEGADA